MSKVPANFIGLSTTIGIQQPIGTYGGQIYLQKWCQPMVFPDVLYWPINYYHRYLKPYRHLYCLQKWCQPMVPCQNWSLGICLDPCPNNRKHGICSECRGRHKARDQPACFTSLEARRGKAPSTSNSESRSSGSGRA